MHSHNEIKVRSVPGFGRRHRIDVVVGSNRVAVIDKLTDERERFFGYLPPEVTGFPSGNVNRPDGKTRLKFLGNNFGTSNSSDTIEIRIGVEYAADGSYCGDEDRCMKVCKDPVWHESGENNGLPFIDCIIPLDTAGFKNMSLQVAGQTDSCATNQRLCGLPLDFPTDRRVRTVDRNVNISAMINNPANGGLIFTCAKASQKDQSYAGPGELCQDEANGECQDADCTKPKAMPGFWRLDLDLEFACVSLASRSKPCQANLAELIERKSTSSGGAISNLNPFASGSDGLGISTDELCFASSSPATNETTCVSDQRLCSDRSGNVAGSCVFRRPEEARRALGSDYWPWSCPEITPKDPLSDEKSRCKSSSTAAFEYVENIQQQGCPASRTKHLIDPKVYEEFPGLQQSKTCFSVVACNPKESCLGDNICAPGYEYNKHRCEEYNRANPLKLNCTSDDECRTRSSGGKNVGSSGLSSACDVNSPEDCSRCVFEDGNDVGTCECMGGGPRCSLCRQAGGGIDPDTGEEWKGYY